ncbi:unnamed protein product [Parnassius mnemosyne]|uniref:Lipase domain-containing protein n=1 Tax=Parnassius mnemosyne TaxID=213953 RepID=A0AAV1LZP0_9NEOP
MNSALPVLIIIMICAGITSDAEGSLMSMMDFRYWRCVMKRQWKCPDSEVNFFLFTPERPYSQWIDVRHGDLSEYGWKVTRKNVLIVHGFNGTHAKTPISFLRDAYLSRKDYNVFMVDWSMLARFPCYLSALANMRLAAQCTAQLYSFMTQSGALAKKTTCVGHSLGAHICGMMSEHLTEKQYKIIGRSRCSHFMSSCYLAASIRRRLHIIGVPCDNTCPKQGRWGIRYDRKPIVLGDEIPDSTRGMFCAKVDHDENCPFD